MLGRQAVVDREHQRTGLAGEKAAGLIVGVEVADHVPAAVVVDDQRRRARDLDGHVEPGRDRSGRPGQLELLDPLDLDPRAGEDARLAAAADTCLGHSEQLRAPREPLEPQRELHLGVQVLAVDSDRRAGERPRQRARKERDRAGDQALGLVAHRVQPWNNHRRQATQPAATAAATAAANSSTSSGVVSKAHIQRTSSASSSQT